MLVVPPDKVSGYQVYQSSSLQDFIDRYSSLLSPGSLFGPPLYLVVQNRNMGEWLKLRLAEADGISAGCSPVLPEKAVRELALGYKCIRSLEEEGDGKDNTVLYMDNLKIRIFKILEGLFSDPGKIPSVCRRLYDYMAASGGLDPKSRRQIRSDRLYGLADSIAGLFSHYAMNCMPLTECWERGEGYSEMPPNLRLHEDWQRYLWERVFESGLSMSRIIRTVEESREPFEGDIDRIVLFGSSFLGDSSLKFFHRLSRDVRVDHFILTPSKSYTSWPVTVKNTLLESWCTQMGGFVRLSSGFEMDRPEFHFPELPESSLLRMVQQDIRENKPFSEEKIRVDREDRSLTVHGCTGPWRECEILKDLILGELDRDDSLKTTDIAVLAPDINVYAPYLEALFPSENRALDLPYNIVDLDSSELSALIQGFLDLISFPGGRFRRSELFALFDNPCFREAHGISRSERDSWLDLCEELNIRWGFDGAHKGEILKGSTEFNSWERAFDRLREGLFLDEEDVPERLPREIPDEESARSWGKLIQLVENLYHDLYELDSLNMSLKEWALYAESLLESYFKARKDNRQDDQDWLRVKGCFRDIINLEESTPLSGDGRFDFFVFRTLLTEFVRKSSSGRGRYLTHGISCSSLKPMRAIPFRRVYILGLNEGAFPGDEQSLSFDLKDVVQKDIDLSRRGGDLYTFLETLLAATDSLTLFYRSRDAVSGEVLQPSMVVAELLDYLEQRCLFAGADGKECKAIEALFREESIHSFDPRYFRSAGGLLSYDTGALESAALSLKHSVKNDADLLSLSRPSFEASEVGDEAVLPLENILSFLKNPAAWYFKRILKSYAESLDSPENEDDEIRELPFLEHYVYGSERLRSPDTLEAGGELDEFFREQQVRGNLPEADIRFLSEEDMRSRLEAMAEQLADRNIGGPWKDVLIDPERSLRRHSHRTELPVDTVPVLSIFTEESKPLYLSGALECMKSNEDGTLWETLEYCVASQPGARHDLPGLLKFLVLCSINPDVRELKFIKIGKQDYPVLTFCRDGEPVEGRVVIPDPEALLERLAFFCLEKGEDVLPLYSDLGDELVKELVKLPSLFDVSDEVLIRLWAEKWNLLAGDERKRSNLRDCFYRQEFFPGPPEVDTIALREMLELIYIPLQKSRKQGGRRG